MATSTTALPGASTPSAIATSADLVATLYRLTVRQFDQMIADGLIAEDDPSVELDPQTRARRSGTDRRV